MSGVGCEGKRPYDTWKAADKAARLTLRHDRARRAGPETLLRPYRCRACGAFHVGNSTGAWK